MPEPLHQAQAFYQSDDLSQAEQLCHEIQQTDPNNAAVWHLLSMIAHRLGKVRTAADRMRQAVQHDPTNGQYQTHASELFRQAERLAEAEAAARAAVRLLPDHPAPHNNLGLVLQNRNQWDQAEDCYRRATALQRDYARAHHNLGTLLTAQNRFGQAEVALREALRIRPNYHQALNAFGMLLKRQYRLDQAIGCFRQALQVQPRYATAVLNLGNTLADQGRLDQAERLLRRAAELKENYAEAWHDLGALLERRNNLSGAVKAYQRALAARPDDPGGQAALLNARRHLCDWNGRDEILELVFSLVQQCLGRDELSPLWPAASIRFPTDDKQRLAIACRYARQIARQVQPVRARLELPRPLKRRGRLRIAFLSHEFGDHVVSYLMKGALQCFDRDRFELHGFAYSPDDGSEIRRRIVRDCDQFLELTAMTAEQAACRIAERQIHILIDMNSYMPGGRPEIAALRPAPIQVSYRYPATMGADYIDYLLTDRIVTPPGREQYYTEKLVYLPHAYLVTDGKQPLPDQTPDRSECGLPPKSFVFCSFNQSHKIEPEIFDVWMRILDRVPGSVLWQICENEGVRDNLRREARGRGVDPNRLVFAGKVPIDQHLARHRTADLFLDTLTHCAIVTAIDALWAGLPLLTCPGQTFTSRAAASFLTAAGLPELIVKDLHSYEQRAIQLAMDPEKLQTIRNKLAVRRKSCVLFDTPRFVANLERAFASMWQVYESGGEPRTFSVLDPAPPQ